ncbi:MAG: hypothetical protein ACREH9_03130 [Pseudomonadota bacterium]
MPRYQVTTSNLVPGTSLMISQVSVSEPAAVPLTIDDVMAHVIDGL